MSPPAIHYKILPYEEKFSAFPGVFQCPWDIFSVPWGTFSAPRIFSVPPGAHRDSAFFTLVSALNVFTPSSTALSTSSITLSVDPRIMIVDMALSSASEGQENVYMNLV